jgi:hypothetical protein
MIVTKDQAKLLYGDAIEPGKRKSALKGKVLIYEIDVRDTDLGQALYIQVWRKDDRRMGWEDVWKVFVQHYPGKWAVQMFPPVEATINMANMYHLFVLDKRPRGLTIDQRN